MKPLYNVLKVGNHLFATNHIYYKNKLGIKESTYDLCLLYSFGLFGVVEMQTDDPLILADDNFAKKEETATQIPKIMT